MKYIFIIACILLSGACSTHSKTLHKKNEIAELDEFNKINACVLGNLPMEIQFPLTGIHLVDRNTFQQGDVEKIAKKLDAKITGLLKLALDSSVRGLKIEKGNLNRQETRELAMNFWFYLIEKAPKRLNIEYCGDPNSVGSQIAASLVGYFGRSCTDDQGNPPLWTTTSERTPNKCGYLLMLAVALENSGYKVGEAILLDELLKSDSSP